MKQMATTMSLSSLIIDDGNTAVLEPEGQVWQTPGRLRDKFGRAITDLPIKDYLRMVRLFVSLGVEKVRRTGGEPLLRSGLVEMVRELAAMRTAYLPDGTFVGEAF